MPECRDIRAELYELADVQTPHKRGAQVWPASPWTSAEESSRELEGVFCGDAESEAEFVGEQEIFDQRDGDPPFDALAAWGDGGGADSEEEVVEGFLWEI